METKNIYVIDYKNIDGKEDEANFLASNDEEAKKIAFIEFEKQGKKVLYLYSTKPKKDIYRKG